MRETAQMWGSAAIPVSQPEAVSRVASSGLPTKFGTFTAVGYRGLVDGAEYIALVTGEVTGPDVLVRVHSECLTGDAFGSVRCDCSQQLQQAQELVTAAGRGVVIYLRGHEGRGVGLLAKLAAYACQDGGLDTVDANRALGLPDDARDYRPAAGILTELGVSSIRLLTNNPRKVAALTACGVRVAEVVPLVAADATPESAAYLAVKRDRLGHRLPAALGVQGAER